MCGCSSHTPTSFHVPDMSCGHCEKSVRSALSKALPDATVVVDLSARTVEVNGDAETARAALIAAGYTPAAV